MKRKHLLYIVTIFLLYLIVMLVIISKSSNISIDNRTVKHTNFPSDSDITPFISYGDFKQKLNFGLDTMGTTNRQIENFQALKDTFYQSFKAPTFITFSSTVKKAFEKDCTVNIDFKNTYDSNTLELVHNSSTNITIYQGDTIIHQSDFRYRATTVLEVVLNINCEHLFSTSKNEYIFQMTTADSEFETQENLLNL